MPCIVEVELPEGSVYGTDYRITSDVTFREFVRRCNKHQLIPAGNQNCITTMIPAEDVVRLHKISDE